MSLKDAIAKGIARFSALPEEEKRAILDRHVKRVLAEKDTPILAPCTEIIDGKPVWSSMYDMYEFECRTHGATKAVEVFRYRQKSSLMECIHCCDHEQAKHFVDGGFMREHEDGTWTLAPYIPFFVTPSLQIDVDK